MEKKSKINISIISIFACIIIIMATIAIVFICFSIQKKEKIDESSMEIIGEIGKLDENQRKVQEAAKLFNSYLLDDTKTTTDYSNLTGIQANYFDPMVGNDSDSQYNILNEYPGYFTEDFTEYENMQNKYASNLTKEIQDNFSLKLKGNPLYTDDKKQLMQIVEVTPFNYTEYQYDLREVQNKLLEIAKIKKKEKIESYPSLYKAHVKAMEILNTNLSEYRSKKKFEANMIYNLGSTITCNNCHFYINYVEGAYLDSVMPYENYVKTKDVRIEKLINNAISKGILDKKNPLELKK